MPTIQEKASNFAALHRRDHAFIIPNPFDAGSARLLAGSGFEALATTSAGYAFSCGLRDNQVTRPEMMLHLASIVAATDLPVSADLENGYGDAPEDVAETIRLAAGTGIVGCSIEDATGQHESPLYDLELAVDRIAAASDAARRLPFAFTLTARAENFLVGCPDLANTIARLQAYQEAGADVLYAPGLTRADDIRSVVQSVDRPLNVLAGVGNAALNHGQLSDLGVKRISVGSAIARAAYGLTITAGIEMRDLGTFQFAEAAIGYSEISAKFPSG